MNDISNKERQKSPNSISTLLERDKEKKHPLILFKVESVATSAKKWFGIEIIFSYERRSSISQHGNYG